MTANKIATRDSILFLTGMLGVGHETLISNVDRPTLLIIFAAMMGLPAFFNSKGGQDAVAKIQEQNPLRTTDDDDPLLPPPPA